MPVLQILFELFSLTSSLILCPYSNPLFQSLFPSILSLTLSPPLRVANVETYLILHKCLERFNSISHLTNWKSVRIYLNNIVGSSWNKYNAPFLTCYSWFYLIKYSSRSGKSPVLETLALKLYSICDSITSHTSFFDTPNSKQQIISEVKRHRT